MAILNVRSHRVLRSTAMQVDILDRVNMQEHINSTRLVVQDAEKADLQVRCVVLGPYLALSSIDNSIIKPKG